MKQLGLDPTTPPDAWLVITKCTSNASALTQDERMKLQQRGIKLEMVPQQMQRTPMQK